MTRPATGQLAYTVKKKMCYFDTKKCAKSLSPVLAQYTCAVVVTC